MPASIASVKAAPPIVLLKFVKFISVLPLTNNRVFYNCSATNMITTAVPKVACLQGRKLLNIRNTYAIRPGERILKAYYRTPIAIHSSRNGIRGRGRRSGSGTCWVGAVLLPPQTGGFTD